MRFAEESFKYNDLYHCSVKVEPSASNSGLKQRRAFVASNGGLGPQLTMCGELMGQWPVQVESGSASSLEWCVRAPYALVFWQE
jgi:hypothetical protein